MYNFQAICLKMSGGRFCIRLQRRMASLVGINKPDGGTGDMGMCNVALSPHLCSFQNSFYVSLFVFGGG